MLRINHITTFNCIAGILLTPSIIAAPLSTIPHHAPSKPAVDKKNNPMFSAVEALLKFSYTDFRFDSITPDNYNRYRGHTNVITVGGNNIQLRKDLKAGVAILKGNSGVTSQSKLQPSGPSEAGRTIRNDSIFGSLTQTLKNKWSLNLSGAYGINHTISTSFINPNTPKTLIAHSSNQSSNWFVSLASLYNNKWKKVSLAGGVVMLYNRSHSGISKVFFDSRLPPSTVAPLTNEMALVSESAEFGYTLADQFKPFISAGLVQIVHTKSSRRTLPPAINGLIPQLNATKSAFKLGGGISVVGKQWMVRLEEQYYNSATTFISRQTILSLRYKFT